MYRPKTKYVKEEKKKMRKRDPYGFKVDQISTIRKPFQREYETKWSAEIFKIQRRFLRQGQPIYNIVDWDDQPVEGTFYPKELQKVVATAENLFKIEHVIKCKGRGKNKEALVKWKGWPKKLGFQLLV